MKQLFKYLPEPRDLFTDGFIRLSQISALNDPFEAAYCEKSLDELVSHFDNQNTYDAEFGNIEFSQYVKQRISHIGVICLSENKENLLMWAHYANDHKGILAGIMQYPSLGNIFYNLFTSNPLINTSYGEKFSPFDGIAKPVKYRKAFRYKNDKYDYDYSNISAEGADRVLYEVFMQKSDEWIYEQEHRIVLRLEQADRVIIKDINAIANTKVLAKLKSSLNVNTSVKDKYVIDLWKFENECERIAVANELVKLSKDPSTIFLMKLKSFCINNCFIGLSSSIIDKKIVGGYANESGFLDIWKVKKNLEYYCLEFEQLNIK